MALPKLPTPGNTITSATLISSGLHQQTRRVKRQPTLGGSPR
jgi:hypothetical protein